MEFVTFATLIQGSITGKTMVMGIWQVVSALSVTNIGLPKVMHRSNLATLAMAEGRFLVTVGLVSLETVLSATMGHLESG